jgi:hypothetical protein
MKFGIGLLAVFLLFTTACGDENKGEGTLGQQASEVVADTQAIKEAEASANQILRNATDCETVKSSIDEVNRTLDEVEGKLQTATGRTSLETLRKQVRRVAEACGAM